MGCLSSHIWGASKVGLPKVLNVLSPTNYKWVGVVHILGMRFALHYGPSESPHKADGAKGRPSPVKKLEASFEVRVLSLR